ncbi:MAG TPA: hypothetical protein VE987_13760 [Polyangiaceae bacterium]|nr:hypothetical protein [Polyangiaceae bacterium]
MDPRVHRRFLEYRERFGYFAEPGAGAQLTYEQFVAADAEQRALEAKGDARDDDDEARFAELNRLLFRD